MSIPVFSMHGFINWAEKQDPAKYYCYLNTDECLAAQYCHAHGLGYGLAEKVAVPNANPNGNFRERLEYISSQLPHTIGAALARAKATD